MLVLRRGPQESSDTADRGFSLPDREIVLDLYLRLLLDPNIALTMTAWAGDGPCATGGKHT